HLIGNDEVVGAGTAQLIAEGVLRTPERLPRRLGDRRRVGVPEDILIVGEEEHLDVPAKSADALGRSDELALLIGLRQLESELKGVASRHDRILCINELDADQRRWRR